MRILFIDPPGIQKPTKNNPSEGLNLAIATLAAILNKHGNQVSLLDMANHYENQSVDSIKKALSIFNPGLIGLSILNAQYENALKIIKQLYEITKVPIVVGGAEITAIEERIFYDTDFAVDISVLGEGEETLVKIVKCFEEEDMSSLERIKGIVINRDRNLIKTGHPQQLENLNNYPFPDLTLFGIKRINMYKVMGSRGCPFNCSFCFSYLGKSWRYREPEKIIKELKEAKEKFGFKEFRFLDPIFNFKPSWVHDLCNLMMKSDLFGMTWEALGVRADKLDSELCKHMADAGCKRVAIGVESLHPEVLKLIKKGETIDQIKNGVKLATEYFEQVTVFMVIGLPSDNKKRSLYSYSEIKKLKPTSMSYAIAVPYSGTRLEKWAKENTRILSDSYAAFTRGSDAFSSGVAFETDDFTKEERLETFNIINTKEFRYVSKSKLHRFLDPVVWLKDAFFYDTFNFQKHFFFISKNIYSRFGNKLKVSVYNDRGSLDIEYKKIPDGTWYIG